MLLVLTLLPFSGPTVTLEIPEFSLGLPPSPLSPYPPRVAAPDGKSYYGEVCITASVSEGVTGHTLLLKRGAYEG